MRRAQPLPPELPVLSRDPKACLHTRLNPQDCHGRGKERAHRATPLRPSLRRRSETSLLMRRAQPLPSELPAHGDPQACLASHPDPPTCLGKERAHRATPSRPSLRQRSESSLLMRRAQPLPPGLPVSRRDQGLRHPPHALTRRTSLQLSSSLSGLPARDFSSRWGVGGR
jgi:hypothetical protein